jgi:hypothetical protein
MTAGGEPAARLSVTGSMTAKSDDQDHSRSEGVPPERHLQGHDGAIRAIYAAKCFIKRQLQPKSQDR